MKSIFLAIFLMASSTAYVLADNPPPLVAPSISAHIILSGVVKAVSWADSTKGTISEIIVRDLKGKVTNILVTPTTTLWDADAKAIMPDKIAAKAKVNVIYITSPEGLNVGKSIKILK